MNNSLNVFAEIPCLTEQSKIFNGLQVCREWFPKSDRRYVGQYLQKFISYNSSLFHFLDVYPQIVGEEPNLGLSFRTNQFIGAIPLRGSDTGKQIGDFIVTPRFSGQNRFEDYIEILSLLEKDIEVDTLDSLPLISGRNFKPPLYLEAIKFINSLEKLLKSSWQKFAAIKKHVPEPVGQVNWSKYILDSYKVEKRLSYPVSKNVLDEFHKEYFQIRYVFDLCKKEILSGNTPIRIKNSHRVRLKFLEKKLYWHKPQFTKEIKIHFSDSPILKDCKIKANNILKQDLRESTAWRVNFSDVFERFVQYIFKKVALETGGKLFPNLKFQSTSRNRFSWELKYLEPDAVYQKNELLIFIDAKYKSNLYNKYDFSEYLKDDHRQDLHQILAYSSFSDYKHKYGFLCYPSNKLELKEISYNNRVNKTMNSIFIFGFPFKKESILEAKELIKEKIKNIETFLNTF